MIRISHSLAVASTLALLPAMASAQLGSYNPEPGPRETFAITGGRIIPVVGEIIERGTVVISNGMIVAVGADAAIPEGAQVIDATGLSVYPGMMAAGTQLGLSEIGQGAAGTVDNAETGNWNPNVRALWGIDPHSAHVGVARVVGITHVVSRPSGGILAGQASLINLAGYTAPAMSLVPAVASVIQLPNASGGRGGGGRFGGARPATPAAGGMTPLDSLKRFIADAKAWGNAVESHANDQSLHTPKSSLAFAAMQPMLNGDVPAIFPAESEAQIKAAVEFAEEHGITPIILGGRDAWRMTDFLVEHDVPVLFARVFTIPRRDDDGYDAQYSAAAKLAEAGVRFAITSGEGNPDIRNLPYAAGMAAAFGLSHADALKSVTLWPAQILGIADRLGSIEVGKMANIVVTTGDLFEPRTDTRYLFIDGRNVPLATKHSELYDTFKDRK